MRIAICSGSFDPITLGHTDIIRRAARCFDRVYVCVAQNGEKRGMFTPEERLELVRMAIADIPGTEAELWVGLLADYATKKNASAIVRGVRNTQDFDWEYQLAMINRSIRPDLETVLLPSNPLYQHLSSTMARDMIRYQQPLENCLPQSIILRVLSITERKDKNG